MWDFLLRCGAENSLGDGGNSCRGGRGGKALKYPDATKTYTEGKFPSCRCRAGPAAFGPVTKQKHYGETVGQRKCVYLVWTGRRERQTGRSWGKVYPSKMPLRCPVKVPLPAKPHLLVGQ